MQGVTAAGHREDQGFGAALFEPEHGQRQEAGYQARGQGRQTPGHVAATQFGWRVAVAQPGTEQVLAAQVGRGVVVEQPQHDRHHRQVGQAQEDAQGPAENLQRVVTRDVEDAQGQQDERQAVQVIEGLVAPAQVGGQVAHEDQQGQHRAHEHDLELKVGRLAFCAPQGRDQQFKAVGDAEAHARQVDPDARAFGQDCGRIAAQDGRFQARNQAEQDQAEAEGVEEALDARAVDADQPCQQVGAHPQDGGLEE
ncbi:MAG: hypothetical protein BWY87_01171 [Deltaproteobacteria bacterium ADurb.Bin510]|nr:MAG: hypothetical protein BWY87_01171 [Deltaproteobacteria bacterium ADurb.Bin510]